MKGKRKNDINIEGRGDIKREGREKDWRNVNIKKTNVKNNYRKIGKKKDNDLNANVTQLECSNNKCHPSTF